VSNDVIDRRFAWFSIGFAVFHFIEETATYAMYGAYFPMLVVDYIAIALLLLGAFLHLRRDWGMGALCGAWGFEACLLYRAFFSRLSGTMQINAVGHDTAEMWGMGVFLIFVFAAFFVSIWRCAPRRASHDASG